MEAGSQRAESPLSQGPGLFIKNVKHTRGKWIAIFHDIIRCKW